MSDDKYFATGNMSKVLVGTVKGLDIVSPFFTTKEVLHKVLLRKTNPL